MAMQKPEFVRSFAVDGAPGTGLAANLIVKGSTTNAGQVMLPAATTDLTLMGVSTAPSDARGNVSVALAGIVQITAGGTITTGALLGSDTAGKAVAITPSGSGTTLRGTIGTALSAAASGQLVDVLLNPGYCQV
jgi:hypothetical protein